MGCPNYAKHHPDASLDEYCEKFGYDKAKLSGAIKNTEKYREMKEKHSGKSDDEIVKQAAWELDKSKSSDGKSLTDAVYNKSGNTGGSQNRESGQKQSNRRRMNFYSAGLEKRAADGTAGEKAEDKTTMYFKIFLGNEEIETPSSSVKLEYLKILKQIASHRNKPYDAKEEFYKMYEKVVYDFANKYSICFSEDEMRKLSEDEFRHFAEVLKIFEDIEKAEKKPGDEQKKALDKLSEKEAKETAEIIKHLKIDRKHAAYELITKLVIRMLKQKIEKEEILKKVSVFIKMIKSETGKGAMEDITGILSPLEKKLLLAID